MFVEHDGDGALDLFVSRFGDSHRLSRALRFRGRVKAARPHAEPARAQERLEWLGRSARFPNHGSDSAALQALVEVCLAPGRRDRTGAGVEPPSVALPATVRFAMHCFSLN